MLVLGGENAHFNQLEAEFGAFGFFSPPSGLSLQWVFLQTLQIRLNGASQHLLPLFFPIENPVKPLLTSAIVCLAPLQYSFITTSRACGKPTWILTMCTSYVVSQQVRFLVRRWFSYLVYTEVSDPVWGAYSNWPLWCGKTHYCTSDDCGCSSGLEMWISSVCRRQRLKTLPSIIQGISK